MMLGQQKRKAALVAVVVIIFVSAIVAERTRQILHANHRKKKNPRLAATPLIELRGGATSSKGKKKIKRKKKQSSSGKEAVSEMLKEKDAATALGDAIRDRADQLRNDEPNTSSDASTITGATTSFTIQDSVNSVGWAMGASDHGGVEAAPASVVVHYFLKSHGGAHALQCCFSVLAALAGLGAVIVPKKNSTLQITLLKRCFFFAMIKHVAGLIAAAFLAAKGSIAESGGFYRAAALMHDLAKDPISQYLFYTANILLWLPSTATKVPKATKGATETVSAAASPTLVWWQAYRMAPVLLVGPVVLRELISTALVISDVLVLWACSTTSASSAFVKRLLAVSQAIVNAFMSLLVTPKVWRSATASQRQAILAKLTSKISLAMELAVGVLLTIDSGLAVIRFLFTPENRPGVIDLMKRLICTSLYLQFLLTRRRKIRRLATTVRGGASQVPLYVLSVLADPRSSMGLEKQTRSTSGEGLSTDQWTWKDYLQTALGFDD